MKEQSEGDKESNCPFQIQKYIPGGREQAMVASRHFPPGVSSAPLLLGQSGSWLLHHRAIVNERVILSSYGANNGLDGALTGV